MLTKKFSRREKVLFLILIVMLLALFYYTSIWQPTSATISVAEATIAELQDYLIVEEAMAAKIASMREGLSEISRPPVTTTVTPNYDNFPNLLDELNEALSITSNKNLSFGDPAIQNGVATRILQLSFDVANYDDAKTVLESIHAGNYRCEITSFKMTPLASSTTDVKLAPVNVVLTVTYYEIFRGS